MLRKTILSIGFFCLLFPSVWTAEALTIYSYSGNSFTGYDGIYNSTDEPRISGSFVVDIPLPANLDQSTAFEGTSMMPVWYEFTDGTHWAYGDPTDRSHVPLFRISTDALGNITSWSMNFLISSTGTYVETVNDPTGNFASIITPPGSIIANLTGIQDRSPITEYDFGFSYAGQLGPVGMAINISPGTWQSREIDSIPDTFIPQRVPDSTNTFFLLSFAAALLLFLKHFRSESEMQRRS